MARSVGPISVAQLCEWGGLRTVQSPSSLVKVRAMRSLLDAGPEDVAFFFSRNYEADLLKTQAGVLVTGESFVAPLLASGLPILSKVTLLAANDPYLAMALLSREFAQLESTVAHLPELPRKQGRIDPTARVAQDVICGEGVVIGAHCVVEAGARLGAGVQLYPGCYVGAKVQIGADSVLFPQVVVYENVVIGSRVRIHAHSTLGADGFGYAPIVKDGLVVDHAKIYHLGRVCVGDGVEIGANVTIDRGTLADTIIEARAKIDNHVHIGHNAWVGEGAILCGGICLAGNARVGQFAYVGGMAGVVNQIEVGARSQVGAMTLVTKDVASGATVVGNPQRESREHFRLHGYLNRLLKEKSRR